MKNIYMIMGAVLMMMSSCQEEIDYAFNSVTPRLVVEGYITDQGVEVNLSRTIDMLDTVKANSVKDAIVMIHGSDGTSEQLFADSNGTYRSVTGFKGISGVTYTLNVTDANHTYHASSEMQKQTILKNCHFEWKKVVSEDMLCFDYEVQDIAGEDNYYCYRMFKNGKTFKWGLFDDNGYKDGVITNSVTCMSKKKYEDNDLDEQDNILHDGDSIRFDVMVISKPVYDYLYSLKLSTGSKVNPLSFFDGGCLGYFSANSVCSFEVIFIYLPQN